MDPPTLITDNSFPSASGAPYNFSEIWPFPINGGGESSGAGRSNLRRPPFAADLSHFAVEAAVSANREVSGDDSMGGGEQSQGGGGSARRRRDATDEEAAMSVSTSSANAANGSDSKRLKTSGSGDENQNSKVDVEGNSGKGVDQGSKSQHEPAKDFIHVRARRGQATDSHSLAERARREKISERMKILQDLVPGCNKVIGKALVLDEIINYIQSLQRQVEFLSMKLEAVNSRMNASMEGYPSKDVGLNLLQQWQNTVLKLLENTQGGLLQNGCTCRLVAALNDKHRSSSPPSSTRTDNKRSKKPQPLPQPFERAICGIHKKKAYRVSYISIMKKKSPWKVVLHIYY